MLVTFSGHARMQIVERKLSSRIIEETVRKPDKVVRQSGTRYRALRLIQRSKKRYVLVVVYDQRGGTQEIVTAFRTSKVKKYL